jgi:hypothetical protein
MNGDGAHTKMLIKKRGMEMSTWLPIVNKKQRILFVIGTISAIIGSLLYLGALIILVLYLQPYEVTSTDISDFYFYQRLICSLLISGFVLIICGIILISYTRSSYYSKKWIIYRRIDNNNV